MGLKLSNYVQEILEQIGKDLREDIIIQVKKMRILLMFICLTQIVATVSIAGVA